MLNHWMPKRIDLSGVVFGRLTVTEFVDIKNGNARWQCACSCGESLTVSSGHLRSGHTSSCGCLQKERTSKARFKHGQSNGATPGATRTYRIWRAMISRCYWPSSVNWERYGGRGITVCRRWREDFRAFFADMGDPPSPKHSIDRKRNSGNYTPKNCRWATGKEQAANRRRPDSRSIQK